MPINYDYLMNKTNEQKLPNARLRNEFIRAANQDPGAFYDKYGYPTPTPPQTEAPRAATGAPGPSLAGMFNPSPYMMGDTVGMGQDAATNVGGGRGVMNGRGLLGRDPALGGIIGSVLGMGGVQNSGLAGQMLSGTPQSMLNAGIGTLAGKTLGRYAGPAMMGLQSLMSGKAPSASSMAKMALSFTPAAPLVGAYNLGQGVVGYLSEREKEKLDDEQSVSNIMGPVNNILGVSPNAPNKPSDALGSLRGLFSLDNPVYAQDNSPLASGVVSGPSSLGQSSGLGLGGGYAPDLGLAGLANQGLIADAYNNAPIDSSSSYSLGVDPFDDQDSYGLMDAFGQDSGNGVGPGLGSSNGTWD